MRTRKRKVARSAGSGRFVSAAEAKRRPATTVVESVVTTDFLNELHADLVALVKKVGLVRKR